MTVRKARLTYGRWYRTGELDDSAATWHIVPATKWSVETYLPAQCGALIHRGNRWVPTDGPGWEWVRTHVAMICLACIDALPAKTLAEKGWDAAQEMSDDSKLTIVWTADGIYEIRGLLD